MRKIFRFSALRECFGLFCSSFVVIDLEVDAEGVRNNYLCQQDAYIFGDSVDSEKRMRIVIFSTKYDGV